MMFVADVVVVVDVVVNVIVDDVEFYGFCCICNVVDVVEFRC